MNWQATTWQDSTRQGSGRQSLNRHAAPTVLAILLAAVLLALPALWNGYPLVYYDTVDYVRMPFTGEVQVFRTASYAVIAAIGRPAGSLWAVLALQCLLVAYMLHEILAVFAPVRPAKALVPLVAVLDGLTGLPWFTSQIMGDAFTGVAVLGMAVLAFGGDRLGRGRRIALTAAVALATAAHTTHLGIVAGLVVCFAGLALAAPRFWPSLRPRMALPAMVLVGAVAITAGANWAVSGRVFVSQPSSILFLARMVQDGLAERYLDEVCPKGAPFRLCGSRHELPPTANDFLWGDRLKTPFDDLGGWAGLDDEARRIIQGSFRDMPVEHAAAAIRLTLQQMAMVRTGDGLVNMDWHIRRTIATLFPDDWFDYHNSHQRQGISFSAFNAVHVPLTFGAYVALIWLLTVAWRRRDAMVTGLCLTVLLSLVGNAFICGALSNPLDRYQGRLAWAAVLAMAFAAVHLVGAWRDERAEQYTVG